MFGRDMENIKEYLEKIGACYQVTVLKGFEQIYVFDKDAYNKKRNHPLLNKDLYVSYLRISDHGGDGLYTRRDGICGELTDDKIKEIIDELTGIN